MQEDTPRGIISCNSWPDGGDPAAQGKRRGDSGRISHSLSPGATTRLQFSSCGGVGATWD